MISCGCETILPNARKFPCNQHSILGVMKPSRRSRLKRVASFAIAITLMTAFA
jgi:hypothetical protein